jgi:predicted AAA+ superfamily ATPase
MLNLLGLFTGKKKSGIAAPAPAASIAAISTIPDRPATSLEERQQLLAHHVRLVARGMANGLCVYGSRGGLGKTRVVLATLKEEGVEPVILTGHCTPLAMYTSLYEHPESVVFLDDCDAMFRILPALGILRSALWEGDGGHRLVTYNSSQLKIPSSFHFTGRIIFAINSLPRQNFAFSAVLSRIDQFELNATNEEVLTMLRQLAAQGFEDKLTADECQEVVSFIAEFSANRELSLRLLEPSLRKVLYARAEAVDWRQLVASQLHEIGRTAAPKVSDSRGYDLECLKQVLVDYPNSIAEQETAWCMLTRRSRATFFRLKKSLSSIGTAQAAMGVVG